MAKQPPTSWQRRDWLFGLILALAVVVTYLPMWQAGYIWDDDDHLTANPCIVGPLGFKEIWTTSFADISPLTRSTFWLEHALWGLAPLPYHLVNVLLHGACAVLLWRVLRNLQVPGAWLGAALWALHPVQVESVAWITEMKNTESGLFFLLSILFFLKWLKISGGWNYALTLLFAAMAMACKSSTVILPVVLCLCAWWMEGRWDWRNLARVAPIFLMTLAASALSLWTQSLHLAAEPDPQWIRTWPERLATAGDAVWFYLGKLLWPHPLIAIYPRWQPDAGLWLSYLPLLAVLVVLSILWLKRESWARPWFFVFAYFLTALLPVLGFLDNTIFRYSLVFDHFQYLASMGPLALAGAGLAQLGIIAIPKVPWLQTGICSGLLLTLAVTSWHRTWVYQNEETLWTDTLSKNPNCWLGYSNLGDFFQQEGRLDAAVTEYKKALAINPNYNMAHNNLGNTYLQEGQVTAAIDQLQRTVEIDPEEAQPHYNLGNALFQNGQTDEAIIQYKKALTIKPDYSYAFNQLGLALGKEGHADEAIIQFQKALEIDPGLTQAHTNLAIQLVKKGDMTGALIQFQDAERLSPDDPVVQNNLAKAQAMLQRAPGVK